MAREDGGEAYMGRTWNELERLNQSLPANHLIQ
jgi:hypothetical protein